MYLRHLHTELVFRYAIGNHSDDTLAHVLPEEAGVLTKFAG